MKTKLHKKYALSIPNPIYNFLVKHVYIIVAFCSPPVSHIMDELLGYMG